MGEEYGRKFTNPEENVNHIQTPYYNNEIGNGLGSVNTPEAHSSIV